MFSSQVAAAIVKLFQKIPPSHPPQKIIEMLCKLILTTEKNLLIEPGSILREPLMGYLVKYPSEAFEYFTTDTCAKDAQNRRYAEFVLKHKEKGHVFRAALKVKTKKLLAMVFASIAQPNPVALAPPQANLTANDKHEVQFAGKKAN